MNDVHIIDYDPDPEAVVATPGTYMAPSTSPAYGVLAGLVVAGRVHGLGEAQLADGQRAIAVRSGGVVANASGFDIQIGDDFFASAKRTYSNWREKWWREAIQNSVDAGATRLDCTAMHLDVNEKPIDPSTKAHYVLVSVEDDGDGMDEDTLVKRFLSLGGTGKRAGGTTGGFGKAKELLLLPWVRWEVDTREIHVVGHGISAERVPSKPRVRGTRVSVLMLADDATDAPQATSFIAKCYLPHVHFTVNGETVKAGLKVGELVRTLPNAEIYYEKKGRLAGQAMIVRINGMYMHERYIGDEIKGTIIVELKGRSIDLMTDNRDGIADYPLSRALDAYQNELAADTKSATKSRNVIKEKYKGAGGKFKIRQVEADVMIAIGNLEPAKKRGGGRTLTDGQVGDVMRVLGDALVGGVESADDAPIDLRTLLGAVEAMVDIDFMGARHVENMAKRLAWEPDFYLVNENADFHVPAKFKPERMSPGNRKLARFWAELCRFVLIQLNYDGEYGVGWVFDREIAAEYRTDEDRDQWLLLNPYVESKLGGDTYSLTNTDHVNLMYAFAVHEATHMADRVTYHNEAFAAALTMNMAKTANRGRNIERIRKAVVARTTEAGKGTELARPPARKAPESEYRFDAGSGDPKAPDDTWYRAPPTKALANLFRVPFSEVYRTEMLDVLEEDSVSWRDDAAKAFLRSVIGFINDAGSTWPVPRYVPGVRSPESGWKTSLDYDWPAGAHRKAWFVGMDAPGDLDIDKATLIYDADNRRFLIASIGEWREWLRK